MAVKLALISSVAALLFAAPAFAWDGTDENGNTVEIDSGNLVRVRIGDSVTYHNDADGEDHDATIDDIQRVGSEVILDVTDDDTGYQHELTMEDD